LKSYDIDGCKFKFHAQAIFQEKNINCDVIPTPNLWLRKQAHYQLSNASSPLFLIAVSNP
jgi:hypothetical protein